MAALRWPGGDNVSGGLCSRVTRTRGGWWPEEGVGEEAGTADGRALLRPGKRRGKGIKWVLLGEARLVVRGNRKRSYGGGDRLVVMMAGQGERERSRASTSVDVGKKRGPRRIFIGGERSARRRGGEEGHGDGGVEKRTTAPTLSSHWTIVSVRHKG
uniref:DUF834 domain-containing protein n=1 Tax=Oryza meridionalis TaxID=40149 RepID=A0A0E0CJU4_9ORYZ